MVDRVLSSSGLMSSSLHLDDIRDEALSDVDVAIEGQGPSGRNQIKLFERYLHACSGPFTDLRSEDSDSCDESIHQGRDSCASSQRNRSGTNRQETYSLDSFLIKPKLARADLFTDSQSTELCLERISVKPRKQPLELCAGVRQSNSKRSISVSFLPTCLEDTSDYDMYETQVVRALNAGKSVWL